MEVGGEVVAVCEVVRCCFQRFVFEFLHAVGAQLVWVLGFVGLDRGEWRVGCLTTQRSTEWIVYFTSHPPYSCETVVLLLWYLTL